MYVFPTLAPFPKRSIENCPNGPKSGLIDSPISKSVDSNFLDFNDFTNQVQTDFSQEKNEYAFSATSEKKGNDFDFECEELQTILELMESCHSSGSFASKFRKFSLAVESDSFFIENVNDKTIKESTNLDGSFFINEKSDVFLNENADFSSFHFFDHPKTKCVSDEMKSSKCFENFLRKKPYDEFCHLSSLDENTFGSSEKRKKIKENSFNFADS